MASPSLRGRCKYTIRLSYPFEIGGVFVGDDGELRVLWFVGRDRHDVVEVSARVLVEVVARVDAEVHVPDH